MNINQVRGALKSLDVLEKSVFFQELQEKNSADAKSLAARIDGVKGVLEELLDLMSEYCTLESVLATEK